MKTLENALLSISEQTSEFIHACRSRFQVNPRGSISHWRSVPWAKGCCCQGTASGGTQLLLSISQKGGMWCGIQQPRKTPSCFTRKPVPAVPPVWCFYCSGSRGPGGRWDAPGCAFLTQCLHSANNGDKSPQVQSSEQGSTLFRERKPAIWEGCAICCHWNHTYLLPSWLHCCLEKKSVCRRV